MIDDFEVKRKNFKTKVDSLFEFLNIDFDYKLKYKKHQQPNGFVTSDTFTFENNKINRKIKISNNYHPNDYGFELTVYDTTNSKNHILKEKSPYLILKKRQCKEQNYLNRISEDFKKNHLSVISGKDFYEDAIKISTAKVKSNNLSTLQVILLWLLMVIILFCLQQIFK